jgi:hypothetical protein
LFAPRAKVDAFDLAIPLCGLPILFLANLLHKEPLLKKRDRLLGDGSFESSSVAKPAQ